MALWSASGAVTKSRPVDMLAVRLSGQWKGCVNDPYMVRLYDSYSSSNGPKTACYLT